jgi:hypothetical protein
MTISFHKTRSITHDHLQFLGSTLQVLQTIPVQRQYPPSTPLGTFLHLFLKTTFKTKIDIGLVPASSTVHDRGLDYSNRFHSTEVVQFTHTIWIPIVWASSPHSILCHDKHPIRAFHSSTLVRVSFTSPACPGSLPQFTKCNSGAMAGEPKCLPVG